MSLPREPHSLFAQWPVLAVLGALHLAALATTFFLKAPQLDASLGQKTAFGLFLAFLLVSEIAFLVLLNGAVERAFRGYRGKSFLDFTKALVLGLALAGTSLSLFKLLTIRSHLRLSDLWFAVSNARQLMQESLSEELKISLALVIGVPLVVALSFSALRRLRRNPLGGEGTVRSFGLLLLLGLIGVGGTALRYESVPALARYLVPEIHWLGRWAGTAEETFSEGISAEVKEAWRPRLITPWPSEPDRSTGTMPRAVPEGQPNVVLIMLESIPWTRLGIGGGRPEATPHLDRLAEDSVVFSRAYTPSVHSDYAQMAILSSLYPRKYDRHDYYTDLSYPRTLLWDVLAPAGWQTSMFSCQNEGWGNMLAYLRTPGLQTLRHSPDWPEAPRRGRGTESKVFEETVVEAWRQWLENKAPGPYFTYLNFQATHFPYTIPEGEPELFSPAQLDFPASFFKYPVEKVPVMLNRFDNALAYVDRFVGEVISTLKERGEWDETLLVVVSDHGEAFYEHGQPTHGTTLFEEQVRSVWLMRVPGMEPRRIEEPVTLLDLAPTLLDVLGLPEHGNFQGRGDVLDPRYRATGRPLFFTIQGVTFEDGVLLDEVKLNINWDQRAHHGYDLREDPEERRNLAGSDPEALSRHRDALAAMLTAQRAYYANRSWEQGFYPPAFP